MTYRHSKSGQTDEVHPLNFVGGVIPHYYYGDYPSPSSLGEIVGSLDDTRVGLCVRKDVYRDSAITRPCDEPIIASNCTATFAVDQQQAATLIDWMEAYCLRAVFYSDSRRVA